jgi:hypothetical protein
MRSPGHFYVKAKEGTVEEGGAAPGGPEAGENAGRRLSGGSGAPAPSAAQRPPTTKQHGIFDVSERDQLDIELWEHRELRADSGSAHAGPG